MAVVYVGGRYAYSNIDILPFQDQGQILSEQERDGSLLVDALVSDSLLVVWTTDKRALSLEEACLGDEPVEPPRLRIYKQSQEFVADLLNSIFRTGSEKYYDLAFDIEFENPQPLHPIFVVDDIRFIDDDSSVLSVLLSASGCGSAGLKYLGFLILDDEGSVSLVEPGWYKAFGLHEGSAIPEEVLAPDHAVVSSVGLDVGFATYSNEDAIFYADVDADGEIELVNAFMLWEEGDDCHWCEHRWLVTVLELAPLGLRHSLSFCQGAGVVSMQTFNPALMNGFLPNSISLLGQVHPVNLQSKNRFEEYGTNAVREIFDEPEACDEWSRYFDQSPNLINFTRIEPGSFDPDTWQGYRADIDRPVADQNGSD